MTRPRRSLGVAALFAVAIASVACGSSGPSSSTLGGPSPASAPSSAVSTAPTRPAGDQASIDDPDLTMTLPTGWRSMPIAEFRDLVASSLAGAPPRIKEVYLAHLKDIDAGAVRLVAAGPSGVGPWTASITLQVDAGDASLEAAQDRVEKLEEGFGIPTTIERRPVVLSVGEAIRIETTHALAPDSPAGSVPSRVIQYVIRLVDDRTLWILATAPEQADGFGELVDASVNTLAVG